MRIGDIFVRPPRRMQQAAALFLIIAGIIAGAFVLIHEPWRQAPSLHKPLALMAVETFAPRDLVPVDADIVALNPIREKYGLRVIEADWLQGTNIRARATHTTLAIVCDAQGKPTKVLVETRFLPGNGLLEEFDVVDGRLEGKSARWVGPARRLARIQSWDHNRVHGTVTFLNEAGVIIARCEYRDGAPWTGRDLQRLGFDLHAEAAYKDGRQHGWMRHYEHEGQGRLRDETHFLNGEQDGQRRTYIDGRLRSESIRISASTVVERSWYDNGQLEDEIVQSAVAGRAYRRWDRAGTLIVNRPAEAAP